ncbi:hypothetical protein [Nonomuraea sp. KM90]|uniref:hypothetical protein n=1 Tax=Nonomuraea sp. KM90 TaxID=3457428 RepID=UPI003FCE0BCC
MQPGGVEDVGACGKDLVEQDVVRFGVRVGDAVGQDVDPVVAVGSVVDRPP